LCVGLHGAFWIAYYKLNYRCTYCHYIYFYVCLPISLSACLSLYLSVSLSLCVSISLCLYLSVSPSLYLSLYLHLCIFISPSLCLIISLYLCLSVSLSFCFSISLYLSVVLSLFVSLQLWFCHFLLLFFKGSNKPYREIPWDFLRGKSKKFRGICRYYFSAPPKFFHNFVSFHPIVMFLTILESGDKTNNIGDEFKTIRLILINTLRYLVSFYSFSDMKTYFGFWKQILNMKDSVIVIKDILKLYLLLVDMIQWKLLNVITLVQSQSDNLNQIICTEFYQEWFGTWPIRSHCLDHKIISDPIKQLSQYWNIRMVT
jgi:hypothetical protein